VTNISMKTPARGSPVSNTKAQFSAKGLDALFV